MTANDKQIVAQGDSSLTGMRSLSELDFQELFQFEEKSISLDSSEAWILKGRVMPYGKGSRRLAMELGVEFLLPETIHVDGEVHSNPYIIFKNGQAVGIYILKHGIAIAPEGIRYLQPNLDYVDLTAIVAAMAMNTAEKVLDKSKDAAKSCSRSIFEKMKENWKKPGDPDWFFIPTLDSETGIAFNQNEKGEAGTAIRKLQDDIIMMRRNPLRKLQTATDRLVFEKLFPEALTSIKEGSLIKCDNYGNTAEDLPKDKHKYLNKVKTVTFKVRVPTKAPIARALLMELGIALRDNDAESRERKFGQIMSALGGTVPIAKLAAGTIQPEDVEQEFQGVTEFKTSPNLKAIPANMDLKQFKTWMKTEHRTLDEDQQRSFFNASGFEDETKWSINKTNWEVLYQLMMEWAGLAPATTGEVTADDMRKHMLDWIFDQDGKLRFLSEILSKYDYDEDMDFALIPDEYIKGIYSKFIEQLKIQERPDNVSS